MEDRLPLNPSIPEHMVEDDVGVWVTFDVPAGHHLYGTFVPVDRNLLPDDVPIQRLVGNVFGQATKPTMDQIRAAVDAAQRADKLAALEKEQTTQSIQTMSAEHQANTERDEQIAAMQTEMEWMRAALKRTALQEKSRVDPAKPDASNEQLSTLRAELAKVKAT